MGAHMDNNKTIDVSKNEGMIFLGVCGTRNARSVGFDVSAWLTAWPNGNLLIIHQRKGDEVPYPVANITVKDNVAIWTFDDVDTAVPGYGSAALAYLVGDDYKARTVGYPTYTAPTIGMAGYEPPDPWKAWYENVLTASDTAQTAADTAVEAATRAEDAARRAEAAAGDIKIGDGLKWNGNTLVVDAINAVIAGEMRPVTSAAVQVEVGNIGALLQTI